MLELELHSFQEGVVSKVPSSVLTAERTDSTRILLDFYSKQVFLYNIQMSACCRVHHFPLHELNLHQYVCYLTLLLKIYYSRISYRYIL